MCRYTILSTSYTISTLPRLRHPNCMLQSSYRWDGLNFENNSFAAHLGVCLKITPTHEKTKYFLFAAEACQLLEYNEYNNIMHGYKVARYICIRRLFLVTACQSLQQRFREDCPCLYLAYSKLTSLHKELLNLFLSTAH